MSSDIKFEKDQYLNPAQKEIKQNVMENLINALYAPLRENIKLFDNQTATDLPLSCLIMFSREVLTNFFLYSNALNEKDQIMEQIFNDIKQQVSQRILEHKESHSC